MEIKKLNPPTLTFILLLSFFSNAQDFQGKAYYQTKTTMDLDNFGGRNLTPDEKKRIQERIKTFLDKTYILTFNKTESMYKEDERLEAPGTGGGNFAAFGSSFSGGPKYKNVKTKELLQDQEFFGKQFLIKDELKPIDWQIGTETKQIGNYLCFKATAVKPLEQFNIRNVRRSNTNEENNSTKTDSDAADDIELPETIEVLAWYTLQIPINQGPDDYWGLPGLILEVNADRTTILCTKIVMNPERKESIDKPEKGKVVTQKEYTEIITKRMGEMRESRRRDGNGGFGRRF